MSIILEKYHGLGNDYFIYDPNKNELPLTQERIKLICNKNFGIGSDGIVEGPLLKEDGIYVKIWNPDGSEAEQSGNGIRIFGKYLKDAGYIQKKHVVVHTVKKEVSISYLNETGSLLRVSMGKPSFWSDEIPVTGERREVIYEDMMFGRVLYPVTCVSVGNPHCIISMKEISKPLVCKIGEFAENARCFPEKINTQIMKTIDEENIAIEIFERGAGYTMASGTGACAAAATAYRLGKTGPKVTVHMAGGTLLIEIDENGEIYMTGDVFYVGSIKLSSEFGEMLRCK